MHKFLLSALCLSCAAVSLLAQKPCDKIVSGKVLDLATGDPLPYVSVRIQETSTGAVTQMDGTFEISHLCEDEVHLEFSLLGYKSVVHHHDLHHKIPTIFMAEDRLELEGIVVEGEQIKSGTVTLNPEILQIDHLKKFGSLEMKDLAANISGLSMISTGQNVQKPILHGLSGNRILLIQQGVRYEYQSWGDDHAPGIDPNGSASVEVIKGAGTVKYGPEAMGGVIVFTPQELSLHQPLNGMAQISGQSNGRGVDGNMRLQQGFDHWSFMLNGSGSLHGDLQAPDFSLTNTGKNVWNIGSGIRYHRSNLDIEAYFTHNDQELGILRGSVTGNLEDLAQAMLADVPLYTSGFDYDIQTPRQEIVHDMASIEGTIYKNDQVFNLKYSWQLNQRKEFDLRRGSNNELPSIDLQLTTQTLDFGWDHPMWRGLDGEVGVSWLYHNNDNLPGTNTIPFLPNYNDTRLGIYAMESKSFNQHTLEAGLRYDLQFTSVRGRQTNNEPYLNDLTFQNLTASLGYKLDIDEKLNFTSNLGTAWRTPDVSELYGFGKHGATIQYGLWRYLDMGELNIDATTVLDRSDKNIYNEVGYKWLNQLRSNGGHIEWILNGYLHMIRNYIFATPRGITTTSRGAFPYFVYRQTDAFIAGIDAEAQYFLTDDFTLKLNSAYVFARDIRDGNYFVEIPPLDIHNQWIYEYKGERVQHLLKLDLSYTFNKFLAPGVISPEDILNADTENEQLFGTSSEIFDFSAPPEGYFLMNLGWEGKWKQVSFSLLAENLLNNTYRVYTDKIRYFAPDTGINFSASLKYSW